MANAPLNVEVDPKELERAQNMWHGFTVMAKWSVLVIVITLGLMAIFLV